MDWNCKAQITWAFNQASVRTDSDTAAAARFHHALPLARLPPKHPPTLRASPMARMRSEAVAGLVAIRTLCTFASRASDSMSACRTSCQMPGQMSHNAQCPRVVQGVMSRATQCAVERVAQCRQSSMFTHGRRRPRAVKGPGLDVRLRPPQAALELGAMH